MTKQNIDLFDPPIESRVDSLLQLSVIVNKFMDVPRATIRGDRQETDGDHSLHLQFIATSYAAKYHPELDGGKVALYALVHDFVEVYAGDINSLVATPEAIVQKALTEKVAFERLQAELGSSWPEFIEHIRSYEELETPEARFVKCFDKCDASISHYHSQGRALLKMGVTTPEEYERHSQRVQLRIEKYVEEFPDVIALRKELLLRVASRTYTHV